MAISQARKAKAIQQVGQILMQLPEVKERLRTIQDKNQARGLNKRLIERLGVAADEFDQINVGEDIEVQNYLATLQDYIKRQQGGQAQPGEKAPQPTFDPFNRLQRQVTSEQLRAGQIPKLASPFEREELKLEREKIGIRQEELGVRKDIATSSAAIARARLADAKERRKLDARFKEIKLGFEGQRTKETTLNNAENLLQDYVKLNEDIFKKKTRSEEGQELIDNKIEELQERIQSVKGTKGATIKSDDEIINAAGEELVKIATQELNKDLQRLGQNRQTIGDAEFKRKLARVIEEIQNQ